MMNERRKAYPNELWHGYVKNNFSPKKFVEASTEAGKIANVKSKSKTFSGDPLLTDPRVIAYLELFNKKQYDANNLVDILSREHPLDKNLPKGGWTAERVLDLFNRYLALSLAKRNTSKGPRVNSVSDVKAINRTKEARRINSPSDAAKYKRRYK